MRAYALSSQHTVSHPFPGPDRYGVTDGKTYLEADSYHDTHIHRNLDADPYVCPNGNTYLRTESYHDSYIHRNLDADSHMYRHGNTDLDGASPYRHERR